MKKVILLTAMPVLAFSQQKIQMELKDLKDPTHTVKTISVIDARADKAPQSFNFKGEAYTFEMPTDINSAVKTEFDNDNKTKGTREIVMLLEGFNISEFNTGKKVVPSAHVRASAFEKKNDQYYYLHTIDKNVGTLDMQSSMTPKLVSAFFNWDISEFLKAAYTKPVSTIALNSENLNSYYNILSAGMPAFNNELKDGVYDSSAAFFNQTPAQGFVLEKNKEGKVTRAKKGDEKIPGYKIFAYVENGKAYKNTYSGFLPMQKDEKGFYLFSNRGELEAIPTNSTLGMFGLVGGIAAAVQQDVKQDKAKKAEKKNIYVDPLTGTYIF